MSGCNLYRNFKGLALENIFSAKIVKLHIHLAFENHIDEVHYGNVKT